MGDFLNGWDALKGGGIGKHKAKIDCIKFGPRKGKTYKLTCKTTSQ